MPNRLTRVPATEVPPLHGVASALVPLADAFMVAMVSRPSTGSLRVTWVTPATFWLAAASALIGVAGIAVAALNLAAGWLAVAGLVLCILLVAGAGAVAVVGAAQRRAA